MDLGKIGTGSSEVGARMQVRHPSEGTELDGAIVLLGYDSPVYRRADRDARTAMMRAATKKGTQDADDIALGVLVACTQSWEAIEEEGKPLSCTPENVRRVYKTLPWLREQVEAFVHDRSHFYISPCS